MFSESSSSSSDSISIGMSDSSSSSSDSISIGISDNSLGLSDSPSKELYYLPSTKKLLKQSEKEESENAVNIMIAGAIILGHSNIEIDRQLQNLNLPLKEDEESQDNDSGSSIDNENKNERSITGSDHIGLETFEQSIDIAKYLTTISIPKTVTVPVKRSLVMEFDDESLS